MSQLCVQKNGEHLCTVGSEDVWMFSASIWAEVFGPEPSVLDVSGSAKPLGDQPGEFLIWEMPHQLAVGDVIDMNFEAGHSSSPKGIPFKDEPEPEPLSKLPTFDWSDPPTESQILALESRIAKNDSTMWSVRITGMPRFELRPDSLKQHISLHLLWNDNHPERIRVSLSRKSLRDIVSRKDGEQLVLDYLPLGSTFSVAIGA